MNRSSHAVAALVALVASAGAASAQTTMPGEFESAASLLRRAFTYFGGVDSTSVALSPATIYSGNSMALAIAFQPDPFFSIAGAGFQSDVMTGPALAIPAGANTFSLTVSSPVASRIVAVVRVREDDNADGVIDATNDDDQWESAPVLLSAGLNSINLALSAFQDTNPGVGNDAQNFLTTPRMRYYLVFESRTTFPGGIQQSPVTLLVDHVGFYQGPQTPPVACAADFNADGALNPDDLSDYITCFFSGPGCAGVDFNADGNADADDLSDFITAFFQGC